MAAPRIEYDTDDKAIEFEQEPGGFEVRPIARVGISRAQTAAFKSSHFGTEDQIIITETGEDGSRLDELMRFWQEFAAKGNSFKVIRDSDLAFYMSFAQRSLKDNNNIAGTFTRALSSGQANASYYDPVGDKVKFAANLVDTPRFIDGPNGQTDGGLLLEQVNTNLLNTDLTTWAAASAILTHNTTEVEDPNGGFTATKVDLTGATGGIIIADTGVPVDANGNFNWYVRPLLSGQTIELRLAGTTTGSLSVNKTPSPHGPDGRGFTRINTGFTGSPFTGNYQPQLRGVSSGEVFYCWLPQIETGTSQQNPTAGILGNALTRATEQFSISNAETIFNKPIRGTIGFWTRPNFVVNTHNASIFFDIRSTSLRLIHMEISAFGNFAVQTNDSDGSLRLNVSTGVSGIVNEFSWDNFFTITWDFSINNELRLFHNGVQLAQSTGTVAYTPPVMGAGSTFRIGSSGGTFVMNAAIAKFFVRRNVLPLNRIQNLYNLPTHLYEQRNEWPKCILSEPTIEPVQIDGAGRWRFQLIVEEVT